MEHPDVTAAERFGVPEAWPGRYEPILRPRCPICRALLDKGECRECGWPQEADS